MQIHASCAARNGAGVLLVGRPGSGKSDLLVRLIDRGFSLVADDRVEIEDGIARPPAALAGLIEVRGLGILRMPYLASAPIRLSVSLERSSTRLPEPSVDPMLARMGLTVPQVKITPAAASAPVRVALALDCIVGQLEQLVGTFAR
jgi:HPr kinase/phosphorylase